MKSDSFKRFSVRRYYDASTNCNLTLTEDTQSGGLVLSTNGDPVFFDGRAAFESVYGDIDWTSSSPLSLALEDAFSDEYFDVDDLARVVGRGEAEWLVSLLPCLKYEARYNTIHLLRYSDWHDIIQFSHASTQSVYPVCGLVRGAYDDGTLIGVYDSAREAIAAAEEYFALHYASEVEWFDSWAGRGSVGACYVEEVPLDEDGEFSVGVISNVWCVDTVIVPAKCD